MTTRDQRPYRLIAHARPDAFAGGTIPILAKLGYQIYLADDLDAEHDEPDLRLVDERRLGEVPEPEMGSAAPILILSGQRGVTGAHQRVVGSVRRPAGLHDLYRVLQQVFEEHPRTTPRVPVHIRARCRRDGREWDGALISLSENGCLLRSSEELPLGAVIDLAFELPRCGSIELRGESSYQLLPDVGLVFSSLAPGPRDLLRRYVSESLAA
jgi:hypothetical protein